MRQRRFHAAIASVGLHLLFVIIAAFLFSGHRELNQDAFEAAFVTISPTRTDVPIRPTRRNVTVNTPQVSTAATVHAPQQLSNLTQLPTEQTAVVREIPELAVDPDVLNPAEMAVSPTLPGVEKPTTSSTHPAGVSVTDLPAIEKSRSSLVQRGATGSANNGLSEFLDGSPPTSGIGDGFDTAFRDLVRLPKGKLGGILEGLEMSSVGISD